MAHVGLEDRQQRADVVAARKPPTQVVDRKNMPEIMHTRAVASAPVGDAGLPEESTEVLVEVPEGERRAGPAGEEPLPAAAPDDLGVVVGEPWTKRLADGHLAVFAALRGPDLQDPGVDVDVGDAQQAGFGGTQAAGIDRAEQHRHDEVAERDRRAVMAAVGLGEQAPPARRRCRCAGRNGRASAARRRARRRRARPGGRANGPAP